MRILKRHRIGLVLLSLMVLIGTLVVFRLKDQQARAVTRPDVIMTSLTTVFGLTISTMLTLVLIPTLHVMLEERFPRRVPAMEGAPVLQGDPA